MCEQMIQIAEATKDRIFYRCEHGTFHLLWNNSVFAMSLEDLYCIQILMIDVRAGKTFAEQENDVYIQRCLSDKGKISYELWLKDVAIRLRPKECSLLEKLINQTLAWVQAQPPYSPEKHAQNAALLSNMDSLPILLKSLYWN